MPVPAASVSGKLSAPAGAKIVDAPVAVASAGTSSDASASFTGADTIAGSKASTAERIAAPCATVLDAAAPPSPPALSAGPPEGALAHFALVRDRFAGRVPPFAAVFRFAFGAFSSA